MSKSPLFPNRLCIFDPIGAIQVFYSPFRRSQGTKRVKNERPWDNNYDVIIASLGAHYMSLLGILMDTRQDTFEGIRQKLSYRFL